MVDIAENFRGLWQGGYYEGNPLDPHTDSSYMNWQYMSVLHATYLRCIKPYINKDTIALEIGCGRGAWSQCMLGAKELYCLDVLSEEESGFMFPSKLTFPNIKYIQVKDFSLLELPDNYVDFVFSFGTFCHLKPMDCLEYLKNLYFRLKPGANCFIMYANDRKYFRTTGEHIPSEGPGRWYDIENFNLLLMACGDGYTLMDRDVGTCLRDPIVWFKK